jgi:hypothetical protein
MKMVMGTPNLNANSSGRVERKNSASLSIFSRVAVEYESELHRNLAEIADMEVSFTEAGERSANEAATNFHESSLQSHAISLERAFDQAPDRIATHHNQLYSKKKSPKRADPLRETKHQSPRKDGTQGPPQSVYERVLRRTHVEKEKEKEKEKNEAVGGMQHSGDVNPNQLDLSRLKHLAQQMQLRESDSLIFSMEEKQDVLKELFTRVQSLEVEEEELIHRSGQLEQKIRAYRDAIKLQENKFTEQESKLKKLAALQEAQEQEYQEKLRKKAEDFEAAMRREVEELEEMHRKKLLDMNLQTALRIRDLQDKELQIQQKCVEKEKELESLREQVEKLQKKAISTEVAQLVVETKIEQSKKNIEDMEKVRESYKEYFNELMEHQSTVAEEWQVRESRACEQ